MTTREDRRRRVEDESREALPDGQQGFVRGRDLHDTKSQAAAPQRATHQFDRSGENIDQRIYDIERRGMHGAIKVIAVSHLTKNICAHRYGVDPEKVEVVYNAIDEDDNHHPTELPPIASTDKIVLFLGRITMQKGPEYFLAAAKRVLEVMDNVKFVMAGSGDMTPVEVSLWIMVNVSYLPVARA